MKKILLIITVITLSLASCIKVDIDDSVTNNGGGGSTGTGSKQDQIISSKIITGQITEDVSLPKGKYTLKGYAYITNRDFNKAFEFYGLNAEYIPIDNMAVYESFLSLYRSFVFINTGFGFFLSIEDTVETFLFLFEVGFKVLRTEVFQFTIFIFNGQFISQI